MAGAPGVGNTRPALPDHRSFQRSGRGGIPGIGNDDVAPITYEGYNITPKDLEYDESRGRWYRAYTKPMPATQRELQNLIRTRPSSACTVMEELYGARMSGSKLEHVENFINERDASNPEREHKLAYLKLDRYHKSRDSKKLKRSTSSMQIVLECGLRPSSDPAHTPLSALPSQRSINSNGDFPSKFAPGMAPNVPIVASRPQYLPSYVRQKEPVWNANPRDVHAIINGSRRNQATTPMSTSNQYDSDDSGDSLSATPSSTASSDTGGRSRRVSSSSTPNGTPPSAESIAQTGSVTQGACIVEDHDQGQSLSSTERKVGESYPSMSPTHTREQGFVSASLDTQPKSQYCLPQPLYASVSCQTDQTLDSHGPCQPTPIDPICAKPKAHPSEKAEDRELAILGHDFAKLTDTDDEATPMVDSSNGPRHSSNRGANESMSCNVAPEKPPWMNNLQPICTPMIPEDNDDPFEESFDIGLAAKQGLSELAIGNPSSVKTQVQSKDDTPCSVGVPNHTSRQMEVVASPVTTPRTTHEPATTGDAHFRHDVMFSERSLKQPKNFQAFDNSLPLPQLRLQTQAQPRRHSEEASPKQRKKVTFSIPSPASTVPSSPIATPTSSPDTGSSSSSDFVTSRPKQATHATIDSPTSTRPPLHRTSQISSSYTTNPRSHAPLPPRSSSCKDLPAKSVEVRTRPPKDNEAGRWSTHPANNNRKQGSEDHDRRHSEPVIIRGAADSQSPRIIQSTLQVPSRKIYDCKIIRCHRKGLSGFSSREDLEAHMRSNHSKDISGRR